MAPIKAENAAAKTQQKEVCVVTHVQDGEVKESKVFADRKAGIAYWLELSEAKAEGNNDNFTDDDELRISVEEVTYPDTTPSTSEGQTMLDRIRYRVARFIAPDPARLVRVLDVETLGEIRQLALEEAAQICDKLAASMEVEHDFLGKGEASPCFEALAIDDAARTIRYRARHLRFDVDHHRQTRAETRRKKSVAAGAVELFG